MEGNLPNWNGASVVYSKAYRMLGNMARRGCSVRNYQRGGYRCFVNDDMTDLISALSKGDEEKIKGLLLLTHIYY